MTLSITIDLPADIEQQLRLEMTDLAADVLEVYAVELYRRNRLTHYQLSEVLKVDRFETDGVLKKHGVALEITSEEFAKELGDVRKLIHE